VGKLELDINGTVAKSCATVGDVPNYNLTTAGFRESESQLLKIV
jgi:hypothetical protein